MSAFRQLKEDPQQRQAFDSWYRQTYPALFMSAFRMTHGDRPLAEDLCHDAILAFIARGGIHKVADEGHALAYLRAMIAHAHIDAFRRRRKEIAVDTPPDIASEGNAIDRLVAQEEYASVLKRLGAQDQELLGMMLAGTPLAEMARTLDISYSNAAVRVHRVRRLINDLRRNESKVVKTMPAGR